MHCPQQQRNSKWLCVHAYSNCIVDYDATSVIQKMQHSHQEMMNATIIYADTAVANEEEDVWISMFEYAGDYSEWGCV